MSGDRIPDMTAPPKKDALPVEDLLERGGGAWRLQGRVNWKNSRLDAARGELRVRYAKGSGTSKDPGVGGMLFTAVPEGLPSRAAKVAWEVYFDRGWHFSKGGKMGGLFVGEGVASGYRHCPTASSHRIMWQRDGGAISYIYPPGDLPQADPRLQAEGCGVAYHGDTAFPAGTLKVGRWNSIVLGVKLNTFDPEGRPNADGVAFLEINGKAATVERVRWARSPDLLISNFGFNTFFGGPDPAVRDCSARYRNFRVLDW